jgi:CDP-diacylglycerol--glycerol-3-phosphate 3-phosphatidyltransferase
MNIPNTLTFIRILMVPILVVVLMTRVPYHGIIGSIVFWIACITDFYDGYLARKLRQITVLGKLLDPLADKLLIAGALLSLIELGLTPAWMAFIILGREMAVTGMRGLASEEGLTMAADWLGKWKLGAQIAAISCLLFGPVLDELIYSYMDFAVFHSWSVGEFFISEKLVLKPPLGFFAGMGLLLMWVAMVLAVWSAIAYARAFWRNLGPRLKQGKGRLARADNGD